MYTINYDSIELYWENSKIMELAQHKTAVRSKSVKLEENDSRVIEDYIITDDDTEYLESQLDRAVSALYSIFHDVTLPKTQGYYISIPSVSLGVIISGFSVRCNRDIYGAQIAAEKRIATLSTLCQEFIVNHIITSWSDDLQIKEYSKINQDISTELIESIKTNLYYLRRRSSGSSYS